MNLNWMGQPVGLRVCRLGRHPMVRRVQDVTLPDGRICCRHCWDHESPEVQAALNLGQPISRIPDPTRPGWSILVAGQAGEKW